VRFLVFYLVCGVLASLGYAAVHWGREVVLVGASGAISGLMGASSRLLDRGPTLAPFTSRTVVGMALAWGGVNVLMAFGWIDVGAGAPIAWEAHLFGYAAGLLLLAPFDRLGGNPPRTLQPRGL
jgi:membrane associated rhomboid family serine protease